MTGMLAGVEVPESSGGELEHSSTHREILLYLSDRYPELRKRLLPRQRVQAKASGYRIPDICILREDAPRENIIRTSPILCIEILSPEDTMSSVMDCVKDYFGIGVPVCWIIDPLNHVAWVAMPGHFEEASDGILRAAGIEMPLAEVLE